MEYKYKRWLSYGVYYIFKFVCGIEYGESFLYVIFQTLWEYLRSLGIPEDNTYYLGLCIAAVTITDMFMSLIIGRLLDKWRRILPMILFLNLFQIVGCGLYFFGISPTFILISRLVAGLGDSASVVFFTDLCRSTSKKERTPIIMIFSIAQQLGILLGPACNLFLRELDFTIFGSIKVNKLNAPGFFLVVIYILFEILALFCYYDLEKAKKQEEERLRELDTSPILPRDILSEETDGLDALTEVRLDDSSSHISIDVPWARYYQELFRGEVVAVVFLSFIGLFGQTCLESAVTPMMKIFFNYGDFENSILYLLGGGELIIVFIILNLLSRRFSDRNLILVGIIVNMVAYLWFVIFIPQFHKGDRSNLPYFAVGTILDLASIPILLDISVALFSKLLPDDVQGFSQGVRRFISRIALLMGPLWGTGVIPWLHVLFGVPLGLLVIAFVMFVCSYSKLVPIPEEDDVDNVVVSVTNGEIIDNNTVVNQSRTRFYSNEMNASLEDLGSISENSSGDIV